VLIFITQEKEWTRMLCAVNTPAPKKRLPVNITDKKEELSRGMRVMF
jgi:hypothetical protein